MIITVSQAGRGKFIARLGDRQLGQRTFMPFFVAARVLAAEGHDPSTKIVMRHEGSDDDALTSTIGEAASLSVDEDGPRFTRYVPEVPWPMQGEA